MKQKKKTNKKTKLQFPRAQHFQIDPCPLPGLLLQLETRPAALGLQEWWPLASGNRSPDSASRKSIHSCDLLAQEGGSKEGFGSFRAVIG